MDMVDGHSLLLRATREFRASIDIFAGDTGGTSATCKTIGGFVVRVFFMGTKSSLLKPVGAFQVLPVQGTIIP